MLTITWACGENGIDKLIQHRAATDLQFVKKQNNNIKNHDIALCEVQESQTWSNKACLYLGLLPQAHPEWTCDRGDSPLLSLCVSVSIPVATEEEKWIIVTALVVFQLLFYMLI